MKIRTEECVACNERKVESTMVYDVVADKYFCDDECQEEYWNREERRS